MLRHALQLALAVSLLALGAWGAVLVVRGRPAPPERDLPGPRPVPVEVMEVTRGPVPRTVELQGSLDAARRFPVASETGGRIAAVHPDLRSGRSVAEGEVLLRISTEDLELQGEAQRTAVELARAGAAAADSDLERARAGLALAEESLALLRSEEERWRALVEESGVERARYDLARKQTLAAASTVEEGRARVQAASAAVRAAALELELGGEQLDLIESRLARCEVRAPFTGRFVPAVQGGTPPEVDQVLAPGVPVGTLVDVATLRLVADVHEDDVGALELGGEATAAPLSRPGLVLGGAITAIGAEVLPVTRSVVVEATFEGGEELPAGTAAAVTLKGAPLQDAIWLDERCIGFRGGGPVAYVIGDAHPEGMRRVEERALVLAPGSYSGGRVVRGGLQAGERVVASSVQLVGDGSLVREVTEWQPVDGAALGQDASSGEPGGAGAPAAGEGAEGG